MIHKEHLGRAVRYFRQKRELTQAHLADLCECPTNSIARIERGEMGASIFHLTRIAVSLEVPVAFLCIMAESEVSVGPDGLLKKFREQIEEHFTQ